MIKNEKQYKITKKKLQEIRELNMRMNSQGRQISVKDQLILASSLHMQEEMENEIAAYEELTNSSPLLEERSIEDLPNLLIEYKIHSGLTQKEFSKKIGMKEQQLQRYEAENFKSISFKNLLKIFHAIGLKITVRGDLRQHPEGTHSIA
jgi:HTH-type transcriptional regulator/antitoxin HipB